MNPKLSLLLNLKIYQINILSDLLIAGNCLLYVLRVKIFNPFFKKTADCDSCMTNDGICCLVTGDSILMSRDKKFDTLCSSLCLQSCCSAGFFSNHSSGAAHYNSQYCGIGPIILRIRYQ